MPQLVAFAVRSNPHPPLLVTAASSPCVTNRQIQEDLTDAALKIPEYYYAPIHAYADGNLCWDSAMEVCT